MANATSDFAIWISLAVPVAVVDRFPSFRRGIAAALREEGLSAEEVTDLCSWAATKSNATALAAIRSTDDLEGIAVARTVNSQLTVVGIQEGCTLCTTRDAFRNGVAAVVDVRTGIAEMVEAIVTASQGMTTLPTAIVWDLASGRGQPPTQCHVAPHEAEWMRELAGGATVTQLARRAGYSEREMYRCLNRLYTRLGVKNRAEALVLAVRWGLVD